MITKGKFLEPEPEKEYLSRIEKYQEDIKFRMSFFGVSEQDAKKVMDDWYYLGRNPKIEKVTMWY